MFYFITVLFVMVSSRANFISYVEAFVYVISALMFFLGVRLNRFRASDFRLFAKFSMIFFAYITIRYIFFNSLTPYYYFSDVSFLLKRVLFAFLYCALLKEETVKYYSKVIIIGAAISLVFYPLQLAIPNVVYGIGEWINLPPRVGNPEYTNFLIFTFDKGHAIRNCGFAWEPGAYGCFLIIGLLLHFLQNNFKWDKGATIIAIAVVTSLSTTAYLGLMLAYLVYYRTNGGKLGPFLFLAVPIIAVVAIEVPFLFDKIGHTYEIDQENLAGLDGMNTYYEKTGDGQIHLNRFASATLLFQLFGYHMIFGVANGYMGAKKILKNVNISNGDADIMAKYGMIGYGFLLYKFGLLFKNFVHKNELVLYCIIVFFALAFGEPMPIFHCTLMFLFLYHYVNPDTLAKRQEQDDENDAEENEEEVHHEHEVALSTGSN